MNPQNTPRDAAAGSGWPTAPVCAVVFWDGSRVHLPAVLGPLTDLVIGAVGAGWLELTDDPAAPALPVGVEIQDGRRLHITGRGLLSRFGVEASTETLLTASGATGHRRIRLVAPDCLEAALRVPTLRPSRMFSADGWSEFWSDGSGERRPDPRGAPS